MTRPAYARRPVARSDGNGALKVSGVVGVLAVMWLAYAWTLMLLVGVIHDWWSLIPTMPYTVALVIGVVKTITAVASGALAEVVREAFR